MFQNDSKIIFKDLLNPNKDFFNPYPQTKMFYYFVKCRALGAHIPPYFNPSKTTNISTIVLERFNKISCVESVYVVKR